MIPCVILCGGRGKRMGSLTTSIPKPLIKIREKPIIWHIIKGMYKNGFRDFIFPLGYKGNKIKEFVKSLDLKDVNYFFENTGIDENIGSRLLQIKKYFKDDCFIMINGDCICDFDGNFLYKKNNELNSLVTLVSCKIISSYGLFTISGDKITSFVRDAEINSLSFENKKINQSYYINSGVTCIKTSALDLINLKKTENFEIDLFNKCIELNKISYITQNKFWTALETPKDVETLNDLNIKSQLNLEYLVYREYLEE